MTVKEGYGTNPDSPKIKFPMAPLCPMLSPKYYEYLISDKSNKYMLESWDLMLGVHDLASSMVSLRKALDRRSGKEEADRLLRKYLMDVD